jgi:hypothetical protein
MDQKTIVLYLHMKGMALDAIHADLVETLGVNAVAYSTVTKYARSARFVTDKEAIEPEPRDTGSGHVDQAILTALDDYPFLSVRELSRMICLPRSTVHRHLTQSLRFTIRHLRWVPHFLTIEQKALRVQMAGELLGILSIQSRRQWHDIVTLDESWFYWCSDHDLMWLRPGETVPDRERYTIQSPKLMVTIVWNPNGFHVVDALPKAGKFNAHYYTGNIIYAILIWRQAEGGTRPSKLWVHADNARPHTAKVSADFMATSGMKRAPHPPYSPDLAPSDFFLFGYVKGKLTGYRAGSAAELLLRINEILAEITQETLNAVFHEWIQRLQKCIDIDGEYVG